jgi:hypothetical protein
MRSFTYVTPDKQESLASCRRIVYGPTVIQKFLLVALAFAAFNAEAAVTITPTSPTSQDTITATIDVLGGCFDTVTTSVIGNTIRTDIVQQGCAIFQPFSIQEKATFGPLAPGTYTFDVFTEFDHTGLFLLSHQTIVIAPAIPAISEIGLSVLAMALAGAACFVLGKLR